MSRLVQIVVACVALAITCAAQTGFPFSSVPAGGMGNAAGISWPTSSPARVGINVGPHPVFPVFPLTPGVPVFFGADQPPANITINNIIPPSEAATQRKPAFEETPSAAPLVIELENGQWVRRRLTNVPPGDRGPQMLAEPQKLAARTPEPVPEATLIFRNGHSQIVSSYTIFGGAMYFSMPPWAPQQKVSLSDLDIPATTAANRQRGIEFRLPNAPNEVVTRP